MASSSNSTIGVRAWLHRYPAATAAASLVLLLGCLLGLTQSLRGPNRQRRETYYFDLSTGELFAAAGGQITPVVNPHGDSAEPTGVLAHVFACGSCADESARYIGWLSKHNETRLQQLREKHGGELTPEALTLLDLSSDGILIRAAQGNDQWVTPSSPAGRQLVAAAQQQQRCGGGQSPQPCVP